VKKRRATEVVEIPEFVGRVAEGSKSPSPSLSNNMRESFLENLAFSLLAARKDVFKFNKRNCSREKQVFTL